MAGLYLHFPFCKQACSYCDFHFSTNIKRADEMVAAMAKELKDKSAQLKNHQIGTIYFGGGSPSLLKTNQIAKLLEVIHQNYKLEDEVEFTLEANPDDFNTLNLKELKTLGLNRLSIGTQSFYDEDLVFMNRAHNALEAENSIRKAQDAGIKNINIDLIYGFDLLSMEKWESNLQKVKELNVWHLSAYSLTIEDGTLLHHKIKQGTLKEPQEELSRSHMVKLMEWAEENSWEHYEISNLCREGKRSKHNTAYWQRVPYLGIGPSAHSFIDNSRSWNVRNNSLYINNIINEKGYSESENLSLNNRYNEYLLMALRTYQGISKSEIESEFGVDYWNEIDKEVQAFCDKGLLLLNKERFTLSKKGKLVADTIASDLFITD